MIGSCKQAITQRCSLLSNGRSAYENPCLGPVLAAVGCSGGPESRPQKVALATAAPEEYAAWKAAAGCLGGRAQRRGLGHRGP